VVGLVELQVKDGDHQDEESVNPQNSTIAEDDRGVMLN